LSEKAPLTTDATKLYMDLFIELFPEQTLQGMNPAEWDTRESYRGACQEIKRDIIKHLGLIDRGGK
jgi:hypothetical protein